MEESLHKLIVACIEGDSKAQKALFDMFSRKMLAVCMRYMNSIEEAEDVLQDGFVKIYTKLSSFKTDGSFEGWVRRIFVNTALDALRASKKTRYDQSLDGVEYKSPVNEQITSDINAEDLLAMVRNLPAGYRTVFNMFAIEGYSHKEIADELKITESTSKSQYSRAKEYLRNKLELMDYER